MDASRPRAETAPCPPGRPRGWTKDGTVARPADGTLYRAGGAPARPARGVR
ncbi:hypothetical protein [Selenomonas sp. ND2010]|uniref:hypothetical protein n=1 Tax=Selenomonas sp. ND2010 TaxID=1410618 RepID=UPI0012DE4C82|nr:hypothetical protein [Selenomonas sp. ND2010]